MKISMYNCKKQLTTIWFTGSVILSFILLFQTFLRHYGDKANEAWSWFLPTVMPTLSLTVGVWVKDALGKVEKKEKVDRFVFRLSYIISILYLIVVALTILLQPLVSSSPQDYIRLMNQSNFLLGPFQGLVVALIGVFFIKREE